MATARTNISTRERPSSQVFIGRSAVNSQSITSSVLPVASPPDIPDLPEPPSPSDTVSTGTSGLPSPPATNSTGSGSTGDPGSIALRSTPNRRPSSVGLGLGLSSNSGEGRRLFHAATMSMRGSHSRTPSTTTIADDMDVDDLDQEDVTARFVPPDNHTQDNAAALLRVKSLSERNRAALNKLTSMSRISSPTGRRSGSETPNTSSPVPAHSPEPISSRRHSQSGSETERESTIASTSSQSHHALTRTVRQRSEASTPPPSTRMRLVSAPASPGKALTATQGSSSNASRRKRVSMASTWDVDDDYSGSGRPSVGSSLRMTTVDLASPTNMHSPSPSRRRNPLPREFVEGNGQPDNRRASRGPTSQSGDFTRSPRLPEDGRRQSLRGGSAESALFAVRSLGLTRRDDPHINGTRSRRGRAGTITATSRLSDDHVQHRENGRSTSMADYNTSGRGEDNGAQEPVIGSSVSLRVNGHGRETPLTRDPPRSPHRDHVDSRPPTSLSRYQRHSLGGVYDSRERDAATSPDPRSTSSGGKRRTIPPSSSSSSHTPSLSTGSISGGTSEHTKLMIDALNLFEGHIARTPSLVPSSAGKEAQTCAYTAERLNALLRLGTTRALEEQIDSSTTTSFDGREKEVDIWKRVGGEYREALRASDELVRSLTGFLLDMGRMLRDLAPDVGTDGRRPPSTLQANGRRSIELMSGEDDSFRRLPSPRPTSALLREREREADAHLQSPAPHHPSLLSARSIRSRDRDLQQTPATASASAPVRNTRGQSTLPSSSTQTNVPDSGSVRRHTLTDSKAGEQASTPPPRIIHTKPSKPILTTSGNVERSRTLPPISIPRPPVTSAPEGGSNGSGLHKRSATSITPSTRLRAERDMTRVGTPVRARGGRERKGSGIYPVSTMNTPTTAVTPHTVSSTRPSPFRDSDDGYNAEDGYDGSQEINRNGQDEAVAFPSVSRGNSQDNVTSGRDRSGSIASSSDGDRVAPGGRRSARTKTGITSTVTRSNATQALRTSLEDSVSPTRAPVKLGHAADRSAAASLLNTATGAGGTRSRRKTVTDIVWS